MTGSARGKIPTMPQHPDRVLPLQGASNFRDLGGYRGRDGRALRWRLLFRSDHLQGLTEADQQTLKTIGLAQSFDFRGEAERATAAYQLPGVAQHSLAIEPTVVQSMQALVASGKTLTTQAVTGLMLDLYRSLVNEQAHRFAELFEHLLQARAPLVFHCTAGKDRTGVAAAWILLALGVPRDAVMQDFLLTNQVLRPAPTLSGVFPAEAAAVLWGVQPTFLETALQVVETEHGGIESYLRQKIGLTPAALQALEARYLQPV